MKLYHYGNLYRFVVPAEYHCDNHTPGDVFTVRLVGPNMGNPGWYDVENIADGDQFPAQLSELTERMTEVDA